MVWPDGDPDRHVGDPLALATSKYPGSVCSVSESTAALARAAVSPVRTAANDDPGLP
ncbi:hypothetical protein LAC03_09010 [Levilactobacillus acidifarinae]|nr:hypothetical protein LAC03_09010 [Levilactobacillus acidifarinae]